MIISGGSRSNWRFFSKHLMKAEENERVEVTEIRGLAADDIREAFREMDALASGTRCKNFFYHANINPRADEVLTPEQWEKAVDTLEASLGLDGHSRFVVEHEKDGRTHRHVVWSRIDTDSMTAVSDSQNYAAHERSARALEEAFGHEAVQGAHDRDGERPDRCPENWETFRGDRSGIDPKTVKAELTALWQQADSGVAFAAALNEQGYVLCKGDRRDFCVIDQAGDAHSLARRISGVKAAEIFRRMADIDRDALPSVAQASKSVKSRKKKSSLTNAGNLSAVEVKPPSNPRAEPTTLEKFAKRVKQKMKANNGDLQPHISGVENSSDAEPKESLSPFRKFVGSIKDVMRAEEGFVPLNDGLTWWQRVAASVSASNVVEAIHHTIEQVTEKVTGYWQSFVDRSRPPNDKQRDDYEFER